MTLDLKRFSAGYVRRTPHMLDTGMTVTDIAPGRGSMVLPARPDWVGDPDRQVLHPGVLTVLADSACGLAVGAALAQPMPYATLDLRMDYLRPAGPDADVFCEAVCYRLTRSVAFVRAEVWQADRVQPIATAQAAFMLGTPPGSPRARQADPAAAAAAASPAAAASAETTAASAMPAMQGGAAIAPAPPSGSWQPDAARTPVVTREPIPYVAYLGMGQSLQQSGSMLYRMPHHDRLIGNPYLPALHGGVVAGFAETAAMLHLSAGAQGTKLPKGIDFSIDYLRPGRPEETFAVCEPVRVGGRVALVQVRCWQGLGPDKPIVVARGHFLMAELGAAI